MPNDSLRRRPTPHRDVGYRCVVARPRDGEPLLLDPVSALIWSHLDGWRTADELDDILRAVFPTVDGAERTATLDTVVDSLVSEGLVERRT